MKAKPLATMLLLLLAAGMGPVSCGRGKPTATAPITIGVAAPLTGNAAAFGTMIKRGAELFVEETNLGGGINGRQVRLVFGDDAADPKEAAAVASRFAADRQVAIVIGHFNSSCSLAARPIYSEAGVVMFSPGSTNPTVAEGSPWAFRNVYRDDVQGPTVARYLKEVLRQHRVAVFYDNDDYGIGLKNAFVQEAARINLNVVGTEAYTRESTDFTPQLTKLKGLNPEVIFISGLYNEAALIAAQASKLGLAPKLVGADGSYSDDLIKIGGQAVEGYLLSVPYVFLEDEPFAQKFRKRYGMQPDAWAGLTYDAVGMALAAIKEVGTDRKRIRDWLAGRTTPEKGYHGVTGLTFFDQNGDVQKPIFFAQVRGGRFIPAPQQLR